jgi:hypothetical protein
VKWPRHRLHDPGDVVTVTSGACHGFDMNGDCWHLPIDGSACVVLSADTLRLNSSPFVVLHDKTPILWSDGDVVCVWDYHVSRVAWEAP